MARYHLLNVGSVYERANDIVHIDGASCTDLDCSRVHADVFVDGGPGPAADRARDERLILEAIWVGGLRRIGDPIDFDAIIAVADAAGDGVG